MTVLDDAMSADTKPPPKPRQRPQKSPPQPPPMLSTDQTVIMLKATLDEMKNATVSLPEEEPATPTADKLSKLSELRDRLTRTKSRRRLSGIDE